MAQSIILKWHDYSSKQTQLAEACALLIVRREKKIKSAVFESLRMQLKSNFGSEEVASKYIVKKQRRK